MSAYVLPTMTGWTYVFVSRNRMPPVAGDRESPDAGPRRVRGRSHTHAQFAAAH
jgi:hypothetical protein